MSAATFIGLAGTLYADAAMAGLAYVLGWTGGFCLVALLHRALPAQASGSYTVADFLAERL